MTGVTLNGRALTTIGSLTVAAITATIPAGCTQSDIPPVNAGIRNESVTIAPNPFRTFTNIGLNDASLINNSELRIYNVLGEEVLKTTVTKQNTTIETVIFTPEYISTK